MVRSTSHSLRLQPTATACWLHRSKRTPASEASSCACFRWSQRRSARIQSTSQREPYLRRNLSRNRTTRHLVSQQYQNTTKCDACGSWLVSAEKQPKHCATPVTFTFLWANTVLH